MINVKKGIHKEEKWVELICKQLEERLDTKKYVVKTQVPLAHAISLNDCLEIDKNNDIRLKEMNLSAKELKERLQTWNVDLFIGERTKDNSVIPRIVIEAKYKDINTHDPITYSYKAELHKNLYPGLRYGLIIGNYLERHDGDKYYIPTRCMEFGKNFDFIFLFEDKGKLKTDELNDLVKVLEDNLKTSEELENFLTKDKKSCCIVKNIEFKNSVDIN